MSGRKTRAARWAMLGMLVGALSVVAAGCGGGDEGGGGDWQVEGLGSTLDAIQANAQAEGKVDLVGWADYGEDGPNRPNADWVTDFEKNPGCDVSTKGANTSDEMV